ncbi:MAG TPA: hypothetical protein VJ874_01970 [Candidatus Thermoplasmatota archaeon]|nr:hypothetical protein [Candidatus Thermoplasmatota archaeon]
MPLDAQRAVGRLEGPEAFLESSHAKARQAAVLAPLWQSSKLWTAALVLALFPFLFILDGAVDLGLSPVLPGVAALFVLLVGLPFLLTEARARRYRRRDADWQVLHAAKAVKASRSAAVAALVWLVAWFAVGA